MNAIRNAAILAILVLAAGCSGQKTDTAIQESAGSGSPYDVGPRAGDFPVEPALASQGAGLFKTKGCTACHAYGKRLTGPDLRGVTTRRTATWMEHQILHPEVMTKTDPISKQLLAQYMVQMSNQGLKPEEAKAVIEYLKKMDEESLVTQQAQAQK